MAGDVGFGALGRLRADPAWSELGQGTIRWRDGAICSWGFEDGVDGFGERGDAGVRAWSISWRYEVAGLGAVRGIDGLEVATALLPLLWLGLEGGLEVAEVGCAFLGGKRHCGVRPMVVWYVCICAWVDQWVGAGRFVRWCMGTAGNESGVGLTELLLWKLFG